MYHLSLPAACHNYFEELFVLMEHVALPAVNDSSKKFCTHGVSDEGSNVPDQKLIMIELFFTGFPHRIG